MNAVENEEWTDMAWAAPAFTQAEVNAAMNILLDPGDWQTEGYSWGPYVHAWEVITNWRSSHSFPLNTLQNGLRAKAKQVTTDYLVAQRIKRLSSIELKLRRFPSMKLSQMQDIGGCRVILPSVTEVRELARLYKRGNGRHKPAGEDDYIENPRGSGYRGMHFIYGYYSDRNTKYNGLKIEIQRKRSSDALV